MVPAYHCSLVLYASNAAFKHNVVFNRYDCKQIELFSLNNVAVRGAYVSMPYPLFESACCMAITLLKNNVLFDILLLGLYNIVT
jgi:hypothetical protein